MPKSSNEDDDHSLREDAATFLPGSFLNAKRFREPLNAFVVSWDAAEAAIKEAELFRQEVVFASIKELRYAGRRFNDALKLMLHPDAILDQTTEINHLLREARENCIRARNDAIDALISYLHKYFDKIRQDYGTVLMNAYFPGFMHLFVRLNEVARMIPDSRANERLRRNEIYDGILNNDIPRLRQLYEQIETSKNLIDEEAKREGGRQRNKEISNRAIGVLGLILAAIGIVLTLLAG